MLEQVAQRSCGCPITGSVQGQAAWDFEPSDLVKDVPAHGRGCLTEGSVQCKTLMIL